MMIAQRSEARLMESTELRYYQYLLDLLLRLRRAQRAGPPIVALRCEAEADQVLRAVGDPLPRPCPPCLFDPGACARRRHGPVAMGA
jgi:hypothetical protein